MIQKINRKEITVKEQIKRIKRPGEIETIRTQVKVNSPQAKRYVASLKRNHTPIINKVYKTMLASKHEVITMEQFEKLLKEYPTPVSNEGELKGRGKEAVLNQSVKSLQLYSNGLLNFTFIVTDLGIRKFTVIDRKSVV